MKEIVNIVKLDFITVKGKSFTPLIICTLLMFVASLFTIAHGITVMATFAGLAVQPIFIVAEQSGYNKLYGVLPVRKRNIVFGRYIFGLSLILAVTLISISLGYIAYTTSLGKSINTFKDAVYLSNLWQTGGVTIEIAASFCFFFGCCLAAVNYTLLFIFGTSKEIPANFGFLAVLVILYFVLAKVFNFDSVKFMKIISDAITNHSILVMVIMYISGVLVMMLGGCISNFFFSKREL
ncbi:MAG: ABC-2 transporter permease [Bacillota bacterium]|nr:ABC-2 transporter permease [Bacillota bacterium]